MVDWLVLCQHLPYSNPRLADQRDYATDSKAEFVVYEALPALSILASGELLFPSLLRVSALITCWLLLTSIWSQRGALAVDL